MTSYPPRVRQDFEAGQRGNPLCTLTLHETATSQWDWGFHTHTLRGDVDPGNLRLCSRVVEVTEIWMIFLSGGETAPFPGSAGPQRWPEG